MDNRELLTTQLSASQPDKPKLGFSRQQIENSPFWIIGNPDNGYNITMGKYKITQEPLFPEHDPLTDDYLETPAEMATAWLEQNKWDVVLTIALCAYTDMKYKSEDINK